MIIVMSGSGFQKASIAIDIDIERKIDDLEQGYSLPLSLVFPLSPRIKKA